MQDFSSLLKQLQKLPRWAQVCIGAGIVLAFLLIAVFGATLDQNPASGPGNNAPSTLWTVLGIFWKLGLVLLIAYFSLYMLRRWQGNGISRAKRQLTILESHHLSPRQTIHLVQVGEQVFFIGATDTSISLISEVALPLQAEPQAAAQAAPQVEPGAVSFAEALAESTQQMQEKRA